MKKIFIICVLFLTFQLFSLELPRPKDDRLFAEYDSFRYAKFLKKPLAGSGYIAMDGKDKFVFIQIKPVSVEIKKSGGRTTYKKGSNMPVDISGMAMDMFFLFESDEKISAGYNVSKVAADGSDNYEITPKSPDNMINIKVTAKEDKVEKIEIFFKDGSRLIYLFKNAVTGKKPDERYF
jgi:Outer membrane lipoprotein carrier protein LolA